METDIPRILAGRAYILPPPDCQQKGRKVTFEMRLWGRRFAR